MMLDATPSSSSSLMLIAQQFFQQQQQEEDPPWHFDDCSYDEYEYQDAGVGSKNCLSSSSCSSQDHQQKQCSWEDCSSSSKHQLQAKDPLEEILDAGYFDNTSAPRTPPQQRPSEEDGLLLDTMISHPTMDDCSSDWMDSFMSELEAIPPIPMMNSPPAAAVAPIGSPESSADALLGCYPPCTPDDIWREHFGINLSPSQPPAAQTLSCSDHHQQQPQENEELEEVVKLLVAALEDIESKRASGAAANLGLLKALADPAGDPMQRVAAHFGDALQLRLNRLSSSEMEAAELVSAENESEVVSAYKVLDEACPYLKFAHLTANQALLDATEGAPRVHIVDFGTVRGVQWAALLQAFSGTSRSLRITGIPSPELGPEPAAAMLAAGRRLSDFAHMLAVDFEFCPVLQPIDRLDADAIRVRTGGDGGAEAVGVNFVLQLAALPAAALRRALAAVHRLNPRIVTVAEFETDSGGCARERLVGNARFYAAVFASLDACSSPSRGLRLRAERLFLAREIRKSLLMEEGGGFSPERRAQWQRCIDEAGLWSAALSHYAASQARLLLWIYGGSGGDSSGGNFTLSHGPGGCISLGWRGRPIVTVSAWHC